MRMDIMTASQKSSQKTLDSGCCTSNKLFPKDRFCNFVSSYTANVCLSVHFVDKFGFNLGLWCYDLRDWASGCIQSLSSTTRSLLYLQMTFTPQDGSASIQDILGGSGDHSSMFNSQWLEKTNTQFNMFLKTLLLYFWFLTKASTLQTLI